MRGDRHFGRRIRHQFQLVVDDEDECHQHRSRIRQSRRPDQRMHQHHHGGHFQQRRQHHRQLVRERQQRIDAAGRRQQHHQHAGDAGHQREDGRHGKDGGSASGKAHAIGRWGGIEHFAEAFDTITAHDQARRAGDHKGDQQVHHLEHQWRQQFRARHQRAVRMAHHVRIRAGHADQHQAAGGQPQALARQRLAALPA
ncbi:hypothetical protein JaAD80_28555 [Janthinobacterium sp. AD80]|nr:hypothetical protein JaAD80_28555 [Janthinobacterium sp. AD80]